MKLNGPPSSTSPTDRFSAAMADAAPSVVAAIASLETYSTALSAFTDAWRAFESDAVRLDSTFASLLAGFSELELLGSAMDGAGLRAHLIEHKDVLRGSPSAIDAGLRVAPDPGLLVLSAASGFCRAPPEEAMSDGDVKVSCRLLVGLLHRMRAIDLKPSPEAREEARTVAADWKRSKRIGTEVVFKKETLAFLLLVGVFGLVEDVGGAGDVLDLVVSISGREHAVDAFVGLGLDLDQHMPVFMQKMISRGKQLDAVKFIQALKLEDKYPLLPVLRSYINDAALAGKMIRIRGDDPASQNAADAKERTLLGTLQKFIKEQKLEELPILEEANKRMAQLEQQSAERKRAAAAASAAAEKISKSIQLQEQKLQQLMHPAKRPKQQNVVQGSSGQIVHLAGTPTQQFTPRQTIHTAGVPNQYQATLTQSVLPLTTQISQLVAGSHRPVSIHNQVPVAPVVPTQYGALADYYGATSSRPYGSGSLAPGPSPLNAASSRPYGSGSLAPGPSPLNAASSRPSSRSRLYSEDPLASAFRSSDKKGSSYSYSLSNMSTYHPK